MPTRDPIGDPSEHQARAMLAHEVRGALTVITGFAEMLKRDLPSGERARAISAIQRAVSRIDRLMDASNIELAEHESAAPVRLRTLAERVAEDQRVITGRSIEVGGTGDPLVCAEPEALERAIGNLIDNALKYSLENSTVAVSVEQDAEQALLSVADRGPGIPAHQHERVFEPFERLDAGAVSGTGLGLTVVKSISETLSGSVSVADRPGGGAVFTIRLPLAG